MLFDLGCNDVGCVVKVGIVKLIEKFIIECYSYVMYIVFNVIGEILDDQDVLLVLLVGLLVGIVLGVFKVCVMEIIDELELEKCGVYGGGVGYFSVGGDMDMCIVLWIVVFKDQKFYIQVGGGVVYDSDFEVEFMEIVYKFGVLCKVVEDVSCFSGLGNS